jgi:hypothetical protein
VKSTSKRVTEIRPGIASSLRPVVGIAIAWITSTADKTKVETPEITTKLEAIKPSKSPKPKKVERVISKFLEIQYHCKPTKSTTFSEVGLLAKITNWLTAKTPMVGVNKAKDSSLRDAELTETREVEFWARSEVAAIRPDTAINKPTSTPQRTEQAANTDKTKIKLSLLLWLVFKKEDLRRTPVWAKSSINSSVEIRIWKKSEGKANTVENVEFNKIEDFKNVVAKWEASNSEQNSVIPECSISWRLQSPKSPSLKEEESKLKIVRINI